MRRDELYLRDIVAASDALDRFLAGVGKQRFLGDELRQSAVLQKLTVIGEATARLSAEFRGAHPEVEWANVTAFRNLAVHAYFSVDWQIVWVTATQDAPHIRSAVAAILAEEFPGPGAGNGQERT